jgi:hypothetical protein
VELTGLSRTYAAMRIQSTFLIAAALEWDFPPLSTDGAQAMIQEPNVSQFSAAMQDLDTGLANFPKRPRRNERPENPRRYTSGVVALGLAFAFLNFIRRRKPSVPMR